MCKLGRKIRGKSSFSLQTGAIDEKGAAKRDQGEPWSGAAGVKMSTQPASGSFSFSSQSFITEPSAVEECLLFLTYHITASVNS